MVDNSLELLHAALDEQAVCASWMGNNDEALALFQRLLTAGHLPDDERTRIAANCDFCAGAIAAASG